MSVSGETRCFVRSMLESSSTGVCEAVALSATLGELLQLLHDSSPNSLHHEDMTASPDVGRCYDKLSRHLCRFGLVHVA